MRQWFQDGLSDHQGFFPRHFPHLWIGAEFCIMYFVFLNHCNMSKGRLQLKKKEESALFLRLFQLFLRSVISWRSKAGFCFTALTLLRPFTDKLTYPRLASTFSYLSVNKISKRSPEKTNVGCFLSTTYAGTRSRTGGFFKTVPFTSNISLESVYEIKWSFMSLEIMAIPHELKFKYKP
jgi:hypothetical protein